MGDVPGIIASVVTFAVWLVIAKATMAVMRGGSAAQRLKFWQFTLVQLFVLSIAVAALFWAWRMVYFDRFGPA